MNKTKILILGCRSFASQGLPELLAESGFDVNCFARGEEGKVGNLITGDSFSLCSNNYLNEDYDIVINFVIIKNCSVNENIKYAKELVKYCSERRVKHLIQISSISVYSNDAKLIDEQSLIEQNHEDKGSYAAVKIAVDKYLMSASSIDCHVSFVRPGFIVSKDKLPSLAGVLKPIAFNLGLLWGNKETILPSVERESLHRAISIILKRDLKNSVYLIFSNSLGTKYNFVKNRFNYKIIFLPKRLILSISKILLTLKIFNRKQHKQVVGLFKTTLFDSSQTEKELNMKF